MKKLITKISFVGIMLSLVPMVADCALKGKTGFGESHGCYVDAKGNDWFWYCGNQGKGCNGVKQKGDDGEKWMHHGQDFNYRDSGHQWCCQTNYPEEDTIGMFHEGDSWIVSKRKVTEQVYDTAGNLVGKCTWEEQTNICGFVDNPQDKCTEATGECEQGYVSHNDTCVKACPTGYAFASEKDNNCVKIDQNDPTQGTKAGSIVQCAENEFYDKKTLECIPQTERIQVSTMAFTQCWKCGTPYLLKQCLLDYSKNGTISSDIKNQCGITQKTSGQKTFVDNGSATTSGTTTAANSSGNSGSDNSGGAATSGTTTAANSSGNSGSGNSGSAATSGTKPSLSKGNKGKNYTSSGGDLPKPKDI